MERRHQTHWLLAAAVLLIAAAVWFGGKAQRSAADEGGSQVRDAQTLLEARLDLETGLRGFLLTGREQFLQPYLHGIDDYREASNRLRDTVDPGSAEAGVLEDATRLNNEWLGLARGAIAQRRAGEVSSVAGLNRRRVEMERFRVAQGKLVALSEEHRKSLQDRASLILLAIIAGLVLLTAIAGYVLIERPGMRRKRELAEQAEFAETLQFADDEREAQELLARELNRAVPGGTAVVFGRNNSENRLETATELEAGSRLAERIETAVPQDCLAVRQGRPVERRAGESRLLECELCGAVGANSLCLPSLVGGEVIGSVMVSRGEKPVAGDERLRLEETVNAAAPVMANLRNLAIAETRAVTDSLTGLANARAAARDVERIVAFAGRTGTPLSAMMLDLDHFKRINDSYGHQIGDETLAGVGMVLRNGTRASDFVARYGGEEFLVLLQDTDTTTAVEYAERLREAIRQMRVPGLAQRVTASFGVASIPRHANEGDSLLRAADRALYAAKKGGRDQVCVAADPSFEGDLQEIAAGG